MSMRRDATMTSRSDRSFFKTVTTVAALSRRVCFFFFFFGDSVLVVMIINEKMNDDPAYASCSLWMSDKYHDADGWTVRTCLGAWRVEHHLPPFPLVTVRGTTERG